jgi:hypothetical protein
LTNSEKYHKEYTVRKALRVQAKTIAKDRVLINFLPLIKFNGYRPPKPSVDSLKGILDIVSQQDNDFKGFADHHSLVKKWIQNDYVDMLYKNSTNKVPKFASLLPLSLNAYKASEKNNINDYQASEQIWHLLVKADEARINDGKPPVIDKLRSFLAYNYNEELDTVIYSDDLELSTWLVASITNYIPNDRDEKGSKVDTSDPLVSIDQAMLLADDVERILAYEHYMSRSSILEALSQIFMLHLGLYVLRVARLLPEMINRKSMEHYFEDDSNPVFQIDLQQGFSGPLAKLSGRNVLMHEQQLSTLVESLYYIRKKIDFMVEKGLLDRNNYTLEQVIMFDEKDPSIKQKVDDYFTEKLSELSEYVPVNENEIEEPFEEYIELLNKSYNQFILDFYKRLLSSAFSKNTETGILQQAARYKKYSLGSKLIDTMIHLAMLKRGKNGNYETKVLRLDQFIEWMRDRYGFYINQLIPGFDNDEAYQALRSNERYFSNKLQEIGYYQALSDAYNTQWLIARYEVKGEE